MFVFIPLALICLAVLLIGILSLYPRSKVRTTIPGLSPSTKEDGNSGDVAKAGSLHKFLKDLHSRFGPMAGFWWGKTYTVSIASPELMTQHSHLFDRPPLFYKSFESLIGPRSVQYANGPDGRTRRRTYDPTFAHDKIAKYMCYYEECVQDVETKWMSLGEDDHIALSEECVVYAIRCAILSVLGDYYKDEKTFKMFKESYMVVWSEMEYRLVNPSASQDEERKNSFEKGLDFLKTSIKSAVTHRRENELHLQNDLLIDLLITHSPDEDTLMSDALSYLIGSFHTTGNLVTWAMYYLAAHKDVQDKLCKEVRSVIGEKAPVDKDNFSEFVYLIQVIDETLRCSVLAPMVARVPDVDSYIGGHRIPKNTPFIYAQGVLSQDEKLWPQPTKFDPDRFSPGNRKKMPNNSFVPFGFGKRKCPGYRLSYWDTGVFLATIVRRFEVSLCGDQEVTHAYGLVTHPKEEVWVKVTKRQ